MTNTAQDRTLLSGALFKLFVNRPDCYIRQESNNTYKRINESLTLEILLEHQNGLTTIGTYQLNLENQVIWLCFDIDPEHNQMPLQTATTIIRTCIDNKLFHKNSILLEASRYPDPSYHVWLFFSHVVPAKVAKWLGDSIILKSGIIEDVELFPKQTKIENGGYGNAVKIPLGLHRQEKKFSRFLDFETLQPLSNTVLFDVEGTTLSNQDIEKILQYVDLPAFIRLKDSKTYYRNRKKIRPCIIEAQKNDLSGSPEKHKMRIAIVAEYHSANFPEDEIILLFKNQKDYNIKETTKQAQYILKRNYAPFKCSTIKSFHQCIGNNCPVFRKQKRTFEKQLEEL